MNLLITLTKKILIILILIMVSAYLQAQVRIKMQKEYDIYTIPCTVNGLKLRFIFDTGASNVSISLAEAVFMLKNGYLDEKDLHGSSSAQLANGELIKNTTITLRELEISGIILHNIEAVIIHETLAPLLLGQSAIQKLGKIQLEGDELIILNAKSSPKIEGNIKWDDLPYYKEAIFYYTKVIESNPNDATAYYNRGRVKAMIFDYREAISDYTKAIELDPQLTDAYYARGDAKEMLEENEKTINSYTEIINNSPDDRMAYLMRGYYKAHLNDYVGAIYDYTKAIEIDPQVTDAYCARGHAKEMLEDYRGVIADFTKVIEIDPNYRESAYFYIGNAKEHLNDYRGAITDYTKAIEIHPNRYRNLYYYRGNVKEIIVDYKGAIDDFTKAIEVDPEHAKAYYSRGLLRIRLGQKDSGCTDLSKAGELGYRVAYETIKENCN